MRIGQARRQARNTAALMAIVLAGVLAVAIVPSAMAAESPRWALVAASNPTNIAPASPQDELQQVTVDATGGTFTLTATTELCRHNETTAPLPANASAAEVQTALEALTCAIVPGGVAVSGGPGGANPYTVAFVGNQLGDRPVALLRANGSALSGGAGSASVTESARGAYTPELNISATNVGGASTDGSTITIEDTLPAGFTATGVVGYDAYHTGFASNEGGSAALSCSGSTTVTCTYSGNVDPGDTLIVTIKLKLASGLPTSVVNQASVVGGGGASAASSTPIAITATPAAFGPTPGSVFAALSSNQAGAHANVSTGFTLDTEARDGTVGYAKDIRFNLPPGLVGTAVGMPQCTIAQVIEQSLNPSACPADTMVGMATLTLDEGARAGFTTTLVTAVYNIAPAPGEPVAFAFSALFFPVRLDTSVLSNGDYGVRVTAPGLPQALQTLSTELTIWGVPADHSGPGPDTSLFTLLGASSFGGPAPGQSRMPLLSNPQQCSEPLVASMETDSWSKPGVFSSEQAPLGTLSGCEGISFSSSFSMLPDTLQAGAPAGYTFDLNVPQSSSPQALATANVKDVKVTLPAGTVVNPSAAWGLQACSNAAFGLHTGVPGACPREAQVGTVEIRTPDLSLPLQGEVFLGEPECDPCTAQDAADGRMVRLLVQVVGEGESGIVVKLEGHGQIDQRTGQITTLFQNNPQLPFNELKLTLGGGPRAVLANPRTCGTARTDVDLTPWSSPFGSDLNPFYEFAISQGCFGPQFNPSFVAGSTNIQAGEYSPFTLSFGRSDQDQFLGGLQLQMPPGLLGKLSSVALCGELQAAAGTCGPESSIGHVQVLTGPGTDPFLVSGGQVFITGPYKGAPYGLSIVVPAVAGPYTLAGSTGNGTVVVRAAINVDPSDAHLTITSDPLPTMLDGIPLQLKVVNVTIDRPGFTFNPTSCAKLAIGGTLSSSEGASANVASPFQVTNCAGLAFKPQFKVSTSGRTSRADGASLDVKVLYPLGAKQANIAKVKVELPRQLPSQLKTLQKACTEQVFASNPAACPAASRVGEASASTPVLNDQLHGPAYFVSHGGAKFPELVVVLQGDGVTVDLRGETFISKAGITSSTFNTVPDVPIGSFELKLPEGPYAALAANGNLCKSKLIMPTALSGQNGAVIHQATKVTVTSCPKVKQVKARRKRAKARARQQLKAKAHGKRHNGRGR